MSNRRFAFAWETSYRPAAVLFGATPWTAYVELSPAELHVRYGPWSLRSALSNITAVEVTGGYAWLKTAGPPHLSLEDHGISFATNSERGLCVSFREPVPGIEPTGRIRHPAVTLTVIEIDQLARSLGFATAS